MALRKNITIGQATKSCTISAINNLLKSQMYILVQKKGEERLKSIGDNGCRRSRGVNLGNKQGERGRGKKLVRKFIFWKGKKSQVLLMKKYC